MRIYCSKCNLILKFHLKNKDMVYQSNSWSTLLQHEIEMTYLLYAWYIVCLHNWKFIWSYGNERDYDKRVFKHTTVIYFFFLLIFVLDFEMNDSLYYIFNKPVIEWVFFLNISLKYTIVYTCSSKLIKKIILMKCISFNRNFSSIVYFLLKYYIRIMRIKFDIKIFIFVNR